MELQYTDRRIVRTIYYRILDTLVYFGHNVDDRLYGDTPEEIARYHADIKALKATNKFIDVTSESSRRNRETVKAPEINIHLANVVVGDIGAEPSSLYEDGTGFYLGSMPGVASNLLVEIYLTSMTSDQFFLLNNLMYTAFAKRKYLPLYDEPTEHFLIEQTVMERYDDYDENIKEMRMVYVVPDVFLGDIEVLRTNIVPIKEIKVDIGTGLTDLEVKSKP